MEELKYRLKGVNFLNKTAYKSEYDISLNYYNTKQQKRIRKKERRQRTTNQRGKKGAQTQIMANLEVCLFVGLV